MYALSQEVLLQVCANLSIPDLLALQTTSQLLNGPSASALYRHITVDHISAGLLLETLQRNPRLCTEVHSLKMTLHPAQVLPRDAHTASRSLIPLLELCPNITELEFDWTDVENIATTGIFETLPKMNQMRSFTMRAYPGSVPYAALLPSLEHWSEQLQNLSISGLYEDDAPESTSTAAIQMPNLKRLLLDDVEISDEHLKRLFGQLPALEEASLGFFSSDQPSNKAISTVFSASAPTLRSFELARAWIDREGGDFSLGQEIVRNATPGRLEHLNLDDQIFDKSLFTLPQMSGVKSLEISWVSAIDYADIKEWLQSNQELKLESLKATFMGYQQDLDQEAVEAIDGIAGIERFKFEGVAALGSVLSSDAFEGADGMDRPWMPPLSSAERRASRGVLDN